MMRLPGLGGRDGLAFFCRACCLSPQPACSRAVMMMSCRQMPPRLPLPVAAADTMISSERRPNSLTTAPSQPMKLSPLCTRLLGSAPFLKLLVACKHDLKAMPINGSKINQLTFTNALAALDRRVSGKWVLSDIGAAVKCGMLGVLHVEIACMFACQCSFEFILYVLALSIILIQHEFGSR
jgi:hypothetical protein